jgi:hypothetical protein
MSETVIPDTACAFAATCGGLVAGTVETINDIEPILQEAATLGHDPNVPTPSQETLEGRTIERATRAAKVLCALESAMPMHCQTCPLAPSHRRARTLLGYDRLDTAL